MKWKLRYYVAICHKYFLNYSAERIGNITDNVRLGVGVFNDKIISPFAAESIDPFDSTNPYGIFQNFAFRHIISLTDDIDEFSVSCDSLYQWW